MLLRMLHPTLPWRTLSRMLRPRLLRLAVVAVVLALVLLADFHFPVFPFYVGSIAWVPA